MYKTTNDEWEILLRLLQSIGLSENEAIVYYACLQFSRPTPRKIEKETGITRSAIYKYLDNLKQKGLVIEKRTKNNKRYYITTPIDDAMDRILQSKENELKKLKSKTEKIKKMVRKQQISTNEDDFYISDGIASFYQVLKDILNSRSNTFWIGSAQMLEKLFTAENNFLKKKFSFARYGRRDMQDKGIIIGDKPSTIYYKNDASRQYKQIKLENTPDAFLAISDKHFAAATYKNGKLIFFSTTDKNLIELFKIIFNNLWDKL